MRASVASRQIRVRVDEFKKVIKSRFLYDTLRSEWGTTGTLASPRSRHSVASRQIRVRVQKFKKVFLNRFLQTTLRSECSSAGASNGRARRNAILAMRGALGPAMSSWRKGLYFTTLGL